MNIGLYLSESNGEVSRVIDLPRLAGEFGEIPVVRILDDFFKATSKERIKSDIMSKQLDGIVLAGESPLYYKKNRDAEAILKEVETTGINLNKIGFANIREHAALPHKSNPQDAYMKAKLLIDVALEKVKYSPPFTVIDYPPRKRVAIAGASLEGLIVAGRLLENGYKVFLIDRETKVRMSEEEMAQLRTSIRYTLGHKNLKVFSETTIKEIAGHHGNFTLSFEKGGQTDTLAIGAVVLAVGEDLSYTEELRSVLYVDVDEAGYFKPVNSSSMATSSHREGIFVVPRAKHVAARIAFADSATLNIITSLDEGEIIYEVPVSSVDERLCGGCGTCIKTCMFKASKIDEAQRLAVVDTTKCRGCGNCVTSCPTGARDLLTYPTKYLHTAIEILAGFPANGNPNVLYLLCEGCGYPSLDIAGLMGAEYAANVLPLGVKCGARVDTQLILEAFAKGIDGVLIGKCREDRCENLVGSVDLDRRANLFREILRSRGIDSERLRIIPIESCEDVKAAAEAITFLNDLKTMGVLA